MAQSTSYNWDLFMIYNTLVVGAIIPFKNVQGQKCISCYTSIWGDMIWMQINK